MDQIPAAMDRHLEVVHSHKDGGLLLGASSLTGRYWYGSLWFYQSPEVAPDVEKCTAGVQLESGLQDACWVDSNRVLVGMDTGGLALWELTDNLHTFIEQSSATEHDDIVSSVCVCRESNSVISASYDRCVKVWDMETFRSIHTYRGHTDQVHCVARHPSDECLFLTASQDGTICFWDIRKPKPASRLDKSPLKSAPTCVAWQPDADHSYAVGGECGHLVIKDARSPVSDCVSMVPHRRSITRIQFSNNRNTVLGSVSEDCTVLVVDISEEQPKQLYQSTSHTDFVQGLTWSGSGKLYTCGWDSKVYTHSVPGLSQSNSTEAGPSKMEVNGEPAEKSDSTSNQSIAEKCKVNGETTGVNDEMTQET